MKYVALLRGINVGGKNTLSMKQLAGAMEQAGFKNVSTYINSGNIFFESKSNPALLTGKLEALIKSEFGFLIKVLIKRKSEIEAIAAAIPSMWKNDATMKCDVLFLWKTHDSEEVFKALTIKPAIEDVRYVAGAIIWKVDKENITKSSLMKIIGTDIYANMTVRNCNTVRKIYDRLQ